MGGANGGVSFGFRLHSREGERHGAASVGLIWLLFYSPLPPPPKHTLTSQSALHFKFMSFMFWRGGPAFGGCLYDIIMFKKISFGTRQPNRNQTPFVQMHFCDQSHSSSLSLTTSSTSSQLRCKLPTFAQTLKWRADFGLHPPFCLLL